MNYFQGMNTLPLEVLENVLVKAFALISRMQMMNQDTRKTELFVTLSSVSYLWWQTLSGLPQPDPESRAQHCVRRRVRQLLNRDTSELCSPFVQKQLWLSLRLFVCAVDKKFEIYTAKTSKSI